MTSPTPANPDAAGTRARRLDAAALAALDPAPDDPRASQQLPAFGAMARVVDLDEVVTRVLADNPSPMTLDGTNTYVIGEPGTGEVLIVDPGPDDDEHRARVFDEVARRDATVRAIVVTHHHLDHAEAAHDWARTLGVAVRAWSSEVATGPDDVLTDGGQVPLAGLGVQAVATPGHTRDHLALRLASGALLTGDHVLGRGTSVVAHPDGDLSASLGSLRRVLDLGPDVLYPGHGPALTEDPSAVVRFYLDHRRFREAQVLALLATAPATPGQLVAVIYAEVDRALWPAAEASTRATLQSLDERGLVRLETDGRARLADG